MARMGRMVEYVLAVGVKKPNIDSTQSPELLRRFPPTDHKDFPLPPDIVFFCQPEGCASALHRISLRQTNSFVFTLTDKETSITRYGICCNFYRPCFGVPQERHQEMGRSYSCPIRTKQPIKSVVKRAESAPLNGMKESHPGNSNMMCFSLTSICIVSSFPFFSTFRECLLVFQKLVESRSWTKNIDNCFMKEKRIFFDGNQNPGQIPLLECKNWAIFLKINDLLPDVIKSRLSEIDEWVNNLLKIPLPVAGVNRVEVELLPRHIQPPLTFALPEKSRFTYLDYPIHLPLELLGVETCLKILTCILLEHKVVLKSCDYNTLSISVMALTSMLYPLQYMFPIIPLLPTCMKNAEHLLLAPTPYIIGVPSSFFRIKGASFQVPHDVLIVDLDTNKMSVPLSMDEIPLLPEPDGTELKAQLNKCLSALSFTPVPSVPSPANSSRLSDDSSDNTHHLIYGSDIESVDIAVRSALVKFFCSPNVLGSFLQYTRILRLYPRPVVAFIKQRFIHSIEDRTGFLEALVETQAVQYYAEWMVNPENTVYRKVQNGILDPRIIGDKPCWFSHYVQPLYYQVHNPQSNLGLDLYEDSDTDSEDQDYECIIEEEDESDENSDGIVDVCSCCSSFDESDVEGEGGRKCTKNGKDAVNSKIQQLYDPSYSTVLEEEEVEGLHSTAIANSVYTKPAYRSEEDITMSDSKLPPDMLELDETPEKAVSELSSPLSDVSGNHSVSVASSASDKSTTVQKFTAIIGGMKPRLTRRLSSESVASVVSASSTILPLMGSSGDHIGKYHTNASNQKVYRSLSTSWNQSSMMKNSIGQDQNVYTSENQQLITEVVAYVKSGDGIGWLTTKRLRRLVTDEGLRLYLINQIDTEYDNKLTNLNDVHVSRNVYKGYLELLKLVIEGYEHTVRMKGTGGLSSLFPFLEVVARYYCGKKYTDDSTEMPIDSASKKSGSDSGVESTVRLESSIDAESDRSLHFHRDLTKFSTLQKTLSTERDGVGTSLTYTSLEQKSSGKLRGASLSKGSEGSEGLHLVTKSNCSNGNRFFNRALESTVFEPAGRGVSGTGRRYIFEGLIRNRSLIWDEMDLWEQSFLDFVAAEREATGMDVNPAELIARYSMLSAKEKRSLEEDEDLLLGIVLHNMIGFMTCMKVPKVKIKPKIRSLLAKAHIGLAQTQWINNLLDVINEVEGNDIDLLVPRSRQLKIQIFVVHIGDSQEGPVFFLEVREDCIVLKSTNGSIVDRWWYENVVNLSCSPRTKVLCIWIRSGEQTDLQKICTKKCKLLYNVIKDSMKKAAVRLNKEGSGINLSGDFKVVDTFSEETGILKVSLDGVTIIFIDKKISIDLRNLKNCCAKQKVLLVEEYLPHDHSVVEHQFYTDEANEICYAILCLFSYIAAARNISASAAAPSSRNSSTVSD